MSKKNIAVYGITRSGTTILTETIRVGMDLPTREEAFPPKFRNSSKFLNEKMDEYNFEAGGNESVVLNMHANNFQDFSKNQLKRWISILENRNFHVIGLYRENFKDLVFSNYIAAETGEFSNYTFKKFKASKDTMMPWVKRISILQGKMKDNGWGIPVHQKITMEEFFKNEKITIDKKDFFLDDVPVGTLDYLKAPKKTDRIENWEEALKIYDELYQEFGHNMSYNIW